MNHSVTKHEFASPGWFAALHALLTQAILSAGDLTGVRWSVCEVFTNLPPHLPQGRDGSVAWHYYLTEENFRFGFGEREDVEFRAVIDYALGSELAVIHVGDDPAKEQLMQDKIMQALSEGKAQIFGSRDLRPEQLANYHDALAAVTR